MAAVRASVVVAAAVGIGTGTGTGLGGGTAETAACDRGDPDAKGGFRRRGRKRAPFCVRQSSRPKI